MPPAGCCHSKRAQRLPGLEQLGSNLTLDDPAHQYFPYSWWDPDALALVVLADFSKQPWQTMTVNPPDNSAAHVTQELTDLLGLSQEETAARVPEILAQDRNLSAYFERLFMVTPSSHPATLCLIRSSLLVAGMVAMHYKHKFRRPRPQQFSPVITPLIEPPQTPSYPSGHALQAALTAAVLVLVAPPRFHQPAGALAERVADNRRYARVNPESDIAAAKGIAQKITPIVEQTRSFQDMMAKAKSEMRSAESIV
jgi:hypothetical protein